MKNVWHDSLVWYDSIICYNIQNICDQLTYCDYYQNVTVVGSQRYMWWLHGMTVGMEIGADQKFECQQVGPSDHFHCIRSKLIWIPSIFDTCIWRKKILQTFCLFLDILWKA